MTMKNMESALDILVSLQILQILPRHYLNVCIILLIIGNCKSLGQPQDQHDDESSRTEAINNSLFTTFSTYSLPCKMDHEDEIVATKKLKMDKNDDDDDGLIIDINRDDDEAMNNNNYIQLPSGKSENHFQLVVITVIHGENTQSLMLPPTILRVD